MTPSCSPISARAISSGRVVAVMNVISTRCRSREGTPVDQQRGQAADDQQQHEEDEQAQRVLADRLQVEGHPRGDEEDRDEDPVADRVELALQAGGVYVHPAGPGAQHHPGQHGAEHDIQAEPARDGEQQEQQHHGPAQRGLPGRVLALPDDPLDRAAPGQPRDGGQDQGEHPDQGHRGKRDEMAPLGEEDRDDQDGEEFPDGARGVHVLAELAAEHVVVPQDGQQRAQRRGGQRQPDRHVVLDVPCRGQPGRHPHGEHGRDQPAERSPACPAAAAAARIQLVTGQQEQEAQPDVGQQLDVGRLGQAEHVRADQDAAEQEDDHLRDARARQHGHHQRRKRGHQRHGHQVFQPPVKVHRITGP